MKTINFKRKICCLAAAALLLSAIPAYAEHSESRGYDDTQYRQQRKEEFEKERENLTKELNLTPEQEERFKKNRQEHREQMKKLAVEMHAKQKELRQELEKYDSNQDKINSIISELNKAHAQLIDLRVAKISAVKSILTQQQYEKFKEKMRSRFGKEAEGKCGKRMRKRFRGNSNL